MIIKKSISRSFERGEVQNAIANLLHKTSLYHHLQARVKLVLLNRLLPHSLKPGLHKTHQKFCREAWFRRIELEALINEVADCVIVLLLDIEVEAESALLAIECRWGWATELDERFSKEGVSFLCFQRLPFNVVDLTRGEMLNQDEII